MAYYTDTSLTSTTLAERALQALAQFFKATAERQTQRRIYRTTLNELQALSNRELADLGIHRAHLRNIAREAAGMASRT